MEINVKDFQAYLLQENQKQNLISRKSGEDEMPKHIQDSLAVIDFFSFEDKQVVDIGSGAGFPGMILAISCTDTSFTLIESDLKKSQFLREAIIKLSLKEVDVIRQRVEELGQDPDYRERFDVCTSRAVASMNVMLEYGLPLVKVGGCLLLWKGLHYQQEIDEAKNALAVLGGEVEEVFSYSLMEERDRVILLVRKKRPTPMKYPRRTGIPSKRPL
ncbi:MAG: 16S rRNA (guanine(527)-N(7))-methyltransferase RsmG [Bacillota bacterium]|nr:16S rRNA (guanine(527)-N(7))-methyltransferase RsmG [Bacillota bacterium]